MRCLHREAMRPAYRAVMQQMDFFSSLLLLALLAGFGCASGGGGGGSEPPVNVSNPGGDTGGATGGGTTGGGTTGGGTTGGGTTGGGTTGGDTTGGGGTADGGGQGEGSGGGTAPVFVGPSVKVSVKETGLYVVTGQDLKTAGWDPAGLDPRQFKLVHRGVEVPIEVVGEADGALDSADSIVFYGTAIARDSPQFDVTDTNVYWIGAGASGGLRMAVRDGTPRNGSAITAFKNVLHVEQDTFYTQVIPNGAGKDHWFWGDRIFAGGSANYSFAVQNVSSTFKGCTVRYYLQGKTDDTKNPDHHTRMSLNGALIDDQLWDGFAQFVRAVEVPNCGLVNGANTLTLQSVGGTGAAVDSVLFNWFEVEYWDTYVAESDGLAFNGVGFGTADFNVTGFLRADIRVYDVTDPSRPAEINNARVEPLGAAFRARFSDTLDGRRAYLAATPSGYKKPVGLVLDAPSTLRSPDNGADYLMISHASLLNSITPLADHRRSRGLRVVTADVADVYDEFGDGIFDPQAIKDFITYAYTNWQRPAPLYVLLVGDASLDYKDHFKTGFKNLVPTHLTETSLLGQTAGDNWFVTVSGDDPLPDLFIGRISVKTAAEADAVVAKIMAYETTDQSAWNRRLQFVADNAEASDAPFADVSDQLIADYVPSGYTPLRVYLGAPGGSKAAVMNNINTGALITNYTGHGSVENWAAEFIFSSPDVASLTNAGRPTFVITLNCLNGFFHAPREGGADRVPLAEAFVNAANKGAIAAWSPTGLGFTFEHDHLTRGLFDAFFKKNDRVIGSATTRAKIAAYSQFGISAEPVETFVLFGDPATSLALR